MVAASHQARAAAFSAQLWSFLGLLAATAATGLLTWHAGRTILRPVEELTRSVRAVGEGRLDRKLPVPSRDELGLLVESFNRMTAQLRDLRQSQSAKLLRAQQTSQATIDAFPDPVVVVDPEGHVEMANPAASRMLGVSPGKPATTWYPPESLRSPLDDALRRQRPFLARELDQTVTFRIAGEELSVLPRILPIRDPYGGTLGAAVVLNDVTRFRLLDELKSNLVATASHELKTPLTSLQLAVHVLLSEAVGPLTSKQTELLLDARDNTDRLVRVVDHLLTLARLEHTGEQLAVRPEDPQALLKSAVDLIRPLAEDKHLKVEVVGGDGPLPPVTADAHRLGHALNNLLTNAVAYTPPGGRVTLSARPGKGMVELAVSDTGVGIPPEYVPHVFERFFRIPGRSREHGTGLGLAIVREIVTAHGGNVRCESEPGKGTTFRLTLPVAEVAPAPAGSPPEGPLEGHVRPTEDHP
jgi:NtrC-family two-component system sensor histidine kinase KinB